MLPTAVTPLLHWAAGAACTRPTAPRHGPARAVLSEAAILARCFAPARRAAADSGPPMAQWGRLEGEWGGRPRQLQGRGGMFGRFGTERWIDSGGVSGIKEA